MKVKLAVGVLAVLMSALNAQAAVQTNTTTPFVAQIYISCANGGAGEVVDLSGPLHVLFTYTINKNNISGVNHFQPQNVSGVGETTGLKYNANGITETSFAGSLQNGQYTTTYVNNFYIVGQGPGNNYMIHETEHFTLNADGTTTVYHDNFSATCK